MARPQRYRIRVGDREHEVHVDHERVDGARRVLVDGEPFEVLESPDGLSLVRTRDGEQIAVGLDDDSDPTSGVVRGEATNLEVRSAEEAALEDALSANQGDGRGTLDAPMPGRVVKAMVAVGDTVERGQPVLIIEAMKMENELHAPCDGVVRSVGAAAGDTVEAGQLILEVEAHED